MTCKIECQLCMYWRRLQPEDKQYDKKRTHLGECSNEMHDYDYSGELGGCGYFEPAVKPICQTCASWEHLEDAESPNAGRCLSNKFAYGFPADENGREQLPSDGLMYADAADECAYLWTGPTFGCIHHQPRT